jgi:hypothetical protein
MPMFANSEYPIRDDLAGIHEAQFNGLGAPGTWGTGAQRLAIAAEARQAGYDAGVLEAPIEAGHAPEITLPDIARKVVRRLATEPKDVDQASYNEALAGGLSDSEYVEIVGVVSRMVDFDVFARGMGVPLAPLPEPEPGEPSRERPPEAVQELAWVPTIPNPPEGGAIADELYEGAPKPYIVRGMSLVPDELRKHVALEHIQYLPIGKIMIPDYKHHEGLSRSQAEIVAARVSALNECFF